MEDITYWHFTFSNISSILIIQNKLLIFGIFIHKTCDIIKKNVEWGIFMIIYFSKVNLCAVELYESYKREQLYYEMKKSITSFLKSGIIYKTTESYIGHDGQNHYIDTDYKLFLKNKDDGYIYGVIYKEARVWYKEVNTQTGEIEAKTRPTIEDIQFCYDINRELVGFHTRNRFGYKEFNKAFTEIINLSLEQNNIEYRVEISLYNEGMGIEEIEIELKKIPNIKKLIFSYKAPNPADDNMLDDLSNGLDNALEQMEEANANGMSVIFDSNGKVGLNVESKEIKKNITRIGSLHSSISARMATRNGYASVKAIDKKGKIYTTEDQKPVKREILNEMEFINACKDTIISIFSR